MKRRGSDIPELGTVGVQVEGAALTPLAGMRDLLPPESHARRRISEQIQRVFERHGYDLVTTPLFERVEVFERSLTLDPRDLLRFVEPDGGEVAALRPDMTPQIARVIATRLREHPAPFRLRYEGTVIRRRRGRARRQRQIAQLGVELVGVAEARADAEVVQLICEACEAAGLASFRVELSDVGVARSLLRGHDPRLLEAAAEPLARKDDLRLDAVLKEAGLSERERARIVALAHLHGGPEVLDEAEHLVRGTEAAVHVENVREVVRRLASLGLGARLGVDLGEIRNAAYYTGVSFALFAQGPGEAIAQGGRYDQLLAHYGVPQPATGAGIDVENLLSALDAAGLRWREREGVRIVVAGAVESDVEALARALRAHGIVAASLPGSGQPEDGEGYARAWSYHASLFVADGRVSATRTSDGATRVLSPTDLDALSTWARSTQLSTEKE